ncbi:MAG TPA: DinB family protein [Ktedonobacterales bacterium]|jgi:hypothetical protein
MKFQLPEHEDTASKADLPLLTNALIDDVKQMLRRCVDADVTFVPVDPKANDPAAATADEEGIAWTLGHIIVHMTASSEESAMLAAELARGVEYHGRSRSEVLWTTVTTIAQCRARLEESRRMRLASLSAWPDVPHLSNTYLPRPGAKELGPVTRFLSGLKHDASHLDQLRDVIGQARDYRFQQTLLGRMRQRLRRSRSSATPPTSASPLEAPPVS